MRLDRIEMEESVLVDIISCIDQPALNNTALACRTLDISEDGMRVVSNMHLPVNTLLGLRLDLETHLYRLQAKVCWATDDGGFEVGLLLNPESPDLQDWTKMFQIEF
jgi:hypothetical protein